MIKYHFFGTECAINKNEIDHALITENLKGQNFNITSPVVLVNQIHGSKVFVIDDKSKISNTEEAIDADAIISNLANLNLAIVTADCAPIVLFDEENKVIAAVHAGWQGAFKNVICNAIDEMLRVGASLENIKAIIGPMIRQESYEVDNGFYERFLEGNSANKKFFIESSKELHFLFDLPSYVKEKLRNKGIENIEDDGIDTYLDDKFLSYRKKTHLGIKDDKNRNISVIEIVE
ncbi:MAG: YfiH family protein [Myxococcota bacterium]